MRKLLLLASTSLAMVSVAWSPSATAAPCGTTAPDYAASNGGFGVLDGQMYTPGGNAFSPRGVAVFWDPSGNMPDAATLKTQFPGINTVRLSVVAQGTQYPSGADLAPYVHSLNAQGIVAVIDDHTSSDGQDRGGGTGTIFTGQLLQNEIAAYADWGKTFATDPYVWATTTNEPAWSYQLGGQANMPALVAWQTQLYTAWRQANNNPFGFEATGGWNNQPVNPGMSPTAYASTTNTFIDQHFYGGNSGFSTSQSAVDQSLQSDIQQGQQFQTADGTPPVYDFEWGPSSYGPSTDVNANQVMQAVQKYSQGGTAWMYSGGPSGGDNLLSNPLFEAAAAAFVASGGTSGCPQSPIPDMITTPTAQDNMMPSLGDMANIAGQDSQTSGLSISDVAAIAANGGDAGGVIPVNSQTQAVLSGGSMNPLQMAPRTQAAPGGTMPTPDPVAANGSFAVTSDYATTAAPASNNAGTISGTGDIVTATGGIQTVTITGPGNTLTTGPYNDTVTVQTGGNTIDTGGGNDTVVLAYGGALPSATINLDAPAVTSLGSTGNTIILPAPGTGVLTIRGTLATNDRLDVSKALAGTLWDHQPGTLWNYVTASASFSGCTISVGGHVIAVLPNGSPSGDIGSFVVGH